ncbi:MAG: acetyltransferase [Thiotrichaceae bacterium]|nr:acetyltransferase [Thiotrichaceae bacterium]
MNNSPKNVIILGSGGHARVLLEILNNQNYPILGMTDVYTEKWGSDVAGVPVLGNDSSIFKYDPQSVILVNGLGSTQQTTSRSNVFNLFFQNNYSFLSLAHITAYKSISAVLGYGTQLLAGSIVANQARLGNNVLVNTRAIVEHDCVIHDHCHLATGSIVCGQTVLGEGVHIGAGATIIQGLSIGKNATIAAGAVVVKDVPPNVLVAGIPARIIHHL